MITEWSGTAFVWNGLMNIMFLHLTAGMTSSGMMRLQRMKTCTAQKQSVIHIPC